MNATELTAPAASPENVVPLPAPAVPKSDKPSAQFRQRFKIIAYLNPRTKSQSWRVSGIKRDGSRVRENYAELKAAECRQVDLTTEWLSRQTETAVRATKLTEDQLRLAEMAFLRLEADADLLLAVDHWLKHGKEVSTPNSVRLDEAFRQFDQWLEGKDCPLRKKTQANMRCKVKIFVNSTPNIRVCDCTPDTIEDFLAKRTVSALTRHADKRALSRFFSWCIERPRRWATMNPCHEVRVHLGEAPPPAVLSVKQCRELLRKAEAHKEGCLVPYLAVCLFGGLRPSEAARLDWPQVNSADKEIRLEGHQTKTGRPRVVAIGPTLLAWLKAYRGKAFFPVNWAPDFKKIRAAAGLKEWPSDVLRHTAVSHYFRQTGSYGQTAEQFGNSEAIIKRHYQGRVSSKDTKGFYSLLPRNSRGRTGS